MTKLTKLKDAVLNKPYIYYFIIIIIVYTAINIIINKIYITAPLLFTNNLNIIIPYLLLSLVIAILVPLNINLIIIKFKELRQINKGSGLTFFGVFGGVLGGACPSCFVGLFPAFLGLFGITASLSSLPFYGIEIQIASVIILTVSIYLLTGKNVCKVKGGGKI